MENTIGAVIFLAVGTYLGWTVVRGRAASFLNAVAAGGGGTNAPARAAGQAPSPATVHGGTLQGVPLQTTIPNPLDTPIPNVFNDVFGENGSINGPQYEGPYGPYSPNYSGPEFNPGAPNLGPQIFQGVFN